MEARNREEWLKVRRLGVGGSDAPAVLGLSKWKTPLEVYLEKIGETPDGPITSSMEWGIRLEKIVREAYSDKTGRAVTLPNKILVHPVHKWMFANLDGITDDHRILECKTSAFEKDWGEPGTDEIPLHYLIQVQHQMAVTNFPRTDVAVLIGGRDFLIYTVVADPTTQGSIIDMEHAFMQRVWKKDPPPPVSTEDATLAYRRSEPKAIFAEKNIEDMVLAMKDLKGQLSKLENEIENYSLDIRLFMGFNDTLIGAEGQTLATWKSTKDSMKFDEETFKRENPELYAKYLNPKPGHRRFLLK
jgi:putative phage-type endonuclease